MISMISSVGKNYELGKNNSLIWHFKEDMKFFKETTMGHTVVMGLNTYRSLPGDLPGRKIIVISFDPIDDDVQVVYNIETILDQYKDSEEEIFICGGASIYRQFLPYADKLYLTEIADSDSEADTFFPKFDKKEWKKKIISKKAADNVKFNMCLYTKKVKRKI